MLALVAARLVDEETVAKKAVAVAFVNNPRVKVPRAAKKLVVVAPDLVSTEKIDEVAAFKMSRAKPLIGVWMVVVAP